MVSTTQCVRCGLKRQGDASNCLDEVVPGATGSGYCILCTRGKTKDANSNELNLQRRKALIKGVSGNAFDAE